MRWSTSPSKPSVALSLMARPWAITPPSWKPTTSASASAALENALGHVTVAAGPSSVSTSVLPASSRPSGRAGAGRSGVASGGTSGGVGSSIDRILVAPSCDNGDVEFPPSVRFGSTARLLAAEARRHGLLAPGFKSPPGLAGADRTIRRYAGGAAVVAVRIRDRSLDVVETDMIEGVVVANRLSGSAADKWRRQLAAALHGDEVVAA